MVTPSPTPSPDAQIRDVHLHPGNYSLGLREDGRPVIRRGAMGHREAAAAGPSPEAQRAGEAVLKNLAATPDDPYLKACAQLMVSREHEGEVTPELRSRLQAILTSPGAGRAPAAGARAAAEGEPEVKVRREAAGDASVARGPAAAPAAPAPPTRTPAPKTASPSLGERFLKWVGAGSGSASTNPAGKVDSLYRRPAPPSVPAKPATAPGAAEPERKGKAAAEAPPAGPARAPAAPPGVAAPGAARRGAAAGPTDEPVLGKAPTKGRELEIGALGAAAIAPPRRTKRQNAQLIRDQFTRQVAVVRTIKDEARELRRIDQYLRGEKLDDPSQSASFVKEDMAYGLHFADNRTVTPQNPYARPSRAAIYVDFNGVKILGFSAYDAGTKDAPENLPYAERLTYYPANFPLYNTTLISNKIATDDAFVREFLALPPGTYITQALREQAEDLLELVDRREHYAEQRQAIQERRFDPKVFTGPLRRQFPNEKALKDAPQAVIDRAAGLADANVQQGEEGLARIPARFKVALTHEQALANMIAVKDELPQGDVNYNELRMNFDPESLLAVGVNPNDEGSIEHAILMQSELQKRGFDLPLVVVDNPTTAAKLRIFANADDLRANRPML